MAGKKDKSKIERNQKIVEAYTSGLTSKEVGEQFDLTLQAVLRIVRGNGCSTRPSPGRADLIGKKFNRLTVISEADPPKEYKGHKKKAYWLCRCDCGNEFVAFTANLRNGHTKSCGCYKKEILLKTFVTHGLTIGKKPTLEYRILNSARQRAHKNNIPFDLEPDDIFVPEYCPVFPEIKLKVNKVTGDDSPSIDRLIPELGYIRGNVQIISHKANSIKSKFYDPDDFLQVAIWLEKELKLQKRKHLKVVGAK